MDNYETKVYKNMSAEKKVRLTSQLYVLGIKLNSLNDRKIYEPKTVQKNRRSRRASS